MARTSRRRGHAAASARILTTGLSSAAAFGMVAGMAISSTNGQATPPEALFDSTLTAAPPSVTSSPSPEVVVIVRRHRGQAPSAPDNAARAAPAPTPVFLPGSTAQPVSPPATVAPTPARPRPVARTRAS